MMEKTEQEKKKKEKDPQRILELPMYSSSRWWEPAVLYQAGSWAHTETLKDSRIHTHAHTHLGPMLTRFPAGSSWGHSLTFPQGRQASPIHGEATSVTPAPASQSELPTLADLPVPAVCVGGGCMLSTVGAAYH